MDNLSTEEKTQMYRLAILGIISLLEQKMLLKRGQYDVEKLADLGVKLIKDRTSNVVPLNPAKRI